MTQLLSRAELLEGGMAGRLNKQASTLLALIENHTAHLMSESRQAASRQFSFKPYTASNQLYLSAMAQGRNLAITPTVHDLEKYAIQWSVLVPENPTVRAAVAHLLGQRRRFTRQVAPELSRALGLDSSAVQHAYQALYNQPLTTIYATRLGFGERLRWRWTNLASRLENLSSFWTAFALTLTETVGAGILALPIALALIGPMAGVIVLLVLGLINVLTLAALTEAITRNGNIRYGFAFFGRLVDDYLGAAGAWLFGLALLALNVLGLFAYYTGIATTMTSVTGIPSVIWPVLLFLIAVFVLGQKSLSATVASALLVGAVNLAVILILSMLALPHVRLVNLQHMELPLVNGRPFESGVLGLIFGVVLVAYAGHTSVGNMAKTVLRRDPSGRTLLWGNVTAMLVVVVIYVIWIIAVNGAIPAATLAGTTGTALIPLAGVVGRSVDLFGAIFVLLGMGMASLHFSLALFNQVRELLPANLSTSTTVPRGILRNRVVQFWLAMTPIILICLLNMWLLFTGRESFSRTLGLMGALAAPLICGIFPVLLLAASRRKGDYLPAAWWRWLGNPIVVVAIYLLFFASLVIHGLIIWQNPVERAMALAVSLLVAGSTLLIMRRGSFRRRVVIEVRLPHGRGDSALLAIVGNIPHQRRSSFSGERGTLVQATYGQTGQPAQTITDEIPNFSKLTRLELHLSGLEAKELKVWTHQVLATGDSIALPAQVTIRQGDQALQHDLARSDGQIVTPVTGASHAVEIMFSQQSNLAFAAGGRHTTDGAHR